MTDALCTPKKEEERSMDTPRSAVNFILQHHHAADQRWRAHPFLGLMILAAAVCVAGWGMDSLMQQVPSVVRRFPGGHIPAVFALSILLLFLMRGIDTVLRGRLSSAMTRILFWGFPTVIRAFSKLAAWYEYESLLRIPADDRRTSEQLRLDELRQDLVERYLAHGSATDLEAKRPFSSWMIAEIVPQYENNVEALAYLGAGFLIVVVGLRGIGYIPRDAPELILLSIFLEFTIIGLMALLKFYKPARSESVSRSEGKGTPVIKIEETHTQIAEMRRGWNRLEAHAREIDVDFQEFRKRLERLDHSLG